MHTSGEFKPFKLLLQNLVEAAGKADGERFSTLKNGQKEEPLFRYEDGYVSHSGEFASNAYRFNPYFKDDNLTVNNMGKHDYAEAIEYFKSADSQINEYFSSYKNEIPIALLNEITLFLDDLDGEFDGRLSVRQLESKLESLSNDQLVKLYAEYSEKMSDYQDKKLNMRRIKKSLKGKDEKKTRAEELRHTIEEDINIRGKFIEELKTENRVS